MSKEGIDEYFWNYMQEWPDEEGEYFRLMWNMCRDQYDMALMILYWKYGQLSDPVYGIYQKFMMEKCRSIVIQYMADAPTWIDLFNSVKIKEQEYI